MARRIGTVSGIALRPGVSRNGRLYTKEMIAGAVELAQGRLGESGALPLVDRRPLDQRTHHAADDDSTRVIGRVTSLSLEPDGAARFTADLADTAHGRTIAALIAPKGNGPDEVEPFLKGVSIRGAWLGKPRRVQHEGQSVETADGLAIDGLDYTARPGVHGAEIDDFTPAETGRAPGESEPQRVLIYESVQEATVTIGEADTPAVSKRDSGLTGGGRKYADPGYQKDGKQRYDITTKAKAKAAWSYVNQADNARAYTSAQLKRVKARIIKALKGFGVTVSTQERWLIEPARQVNEALAECWDMDPAKGSLYLSLTNGPTTVSVSSSILDPHDLDLVGRAAMAGACDALMALDPDMDADIDVPGAEPEDTDHGMDGDEDEPGENAPGSACPCGCGCAVPHPMAVAEGCPCGCGCEVCHATDEDASGTGESAPTPIETPAETAAETPNEQEEAPMAESTTPAAETPGTPDGDTLGALNTKMDALISGLNGLVTALTPKPTAEAAPQPPAPAVEAAPAAPVEETQEQMIARLVAEGVKAALPGAVQEHVERQGPPARKGLVAPVSESNAVAGGAEPGMNEYGVPSHWPNKPLHQYTPDERARYFGPAAASHVLGARYQGPEV